MPDARDASGHRRSRVGVVAESDGGTYDAFIVVPDRERVARRPERVDDVARTFDGSFIRRIEHTLDFVARQSGSFADATQSLGCAFPRGRMIRQGGARPQACHRAGHLRAWMTVRGQGLRGR